jgi:hypothetical protein
MSVDLSTLPGAESPTVPAVPAAPTVSAGPGMPIRQRLLFAAIGWVPAVALVVAVVAALGSPESPLPGGSAPGDGAPVSGAAPGDGAASVGRPASAGGLRPARVREPAPETSPRPATRTLLGAARTGNYTGPQIAAAAGVRMTVTYRVTCASASPYLTVSWDGAGPDYDYLTVTEAPRTSGTGTLDPGSKSGRFEVRTGDDCAWSVRVTQTH